MCLLCVCPGLGRLSCDRRALASSIEGALQEVDPLLARTENTVTLGNTMAKTSRSGAAQRWAASAKGGYQWLSLIRQPRWKGKGLLGLGTQLTGLGDPCTGNHSNSPDED